MSEAIERDDHLRRALRDAPDADIAPPAALSQAIRRQAREAIASPSARGRWRHWLAAPFAPWATGLAGVIVASTVAWIWRLDPTPDAGEAPVVASAPQPAAEPARIAGPAAAPAQPNAKSPDSAARADLSRTRPPTAPTAENAAAKERPSQVQPAPAPQAATRAPAAAQDRAQAPDFRRDTTKRELPATGVSTRVIGGADAALDGRQEAGKSAEQSTAAPAQGLEADVAGRAKSSTTPAQAQERRATPMATPRAPGEFAAARQLTAPPLLSRLAALDADAASSWRMRADTGATERELDTAVRAWLSRLLRETGTTWLATVSPRPDAGRTLSFSEGGRFAASVGLSDDGVLWRDEDSGQTWFAPLDAAQRARLGWP